MIFDSHFHIIDSDYPLTPNQGYLPNPFTVNDYKARIATLNIRGGAVVSGSFQAFDQAYLINALEQLGKTYVGVTQLPITTSDKEIIELNEQGIRAVRFNLFRGGSESVKHMQDFAKRIFDLVGWHVELYVDSNNLAELSKLLLTLPKVSIDHLGLSQSGFSDLVNLVEQGIHVKATGFMRVDFDVKQALKTIYKANPKALMFGTDLPGTRASRLFSVEDLQLVENTFSEATCKRIFWQNAVEFYGVNV